MVKKRTEPIWITYKGDYQDPQLTEMHEDEYRASLRTLQDPSRNKTKVEPSLATMLCDWIRARVLGTEFYSEENLQAEIERINRENTVKRDIDIDNDFSWFTVRLAQGEKGESGVISRPAYWQLHSTLEEALAASKQRTEVSDLLGEGYQYDVLFKVKDLRGIITRDTTKPRNIKNKLGAPERPPEEIMKYSYAGHLTFPLLETYLRFKASHDSWSHADTARFLIDSGMRAAEKNGRLRQLPILHEEKLNMRDTSVMLRPRFNEADYQKTQEFSKKYRIKNKQDFLLRLIYEGLLAEGMPQPRGFPEDD